MIPLIYEHDWKPNVWFPNVTGYDTQDILRDKYYRQIPSLLQQCEDLYIFKPFDISNLTFLSALSIPRHNHLIPAFLTNDNISGLLNTE